MIPAPPRKDYSTHALVAHVLLALAAVVVVVMYVPVITGEVSGEGAGMGVFLLLYFLGIPLALAGVAAAYFSIRSRSRDLLLATALLFLGIPAGIAMQSDLAFVGVLCIYIATVLGAILVRAIRDERREKQGATQDRGSRGRGGNGRRRS